MKNRLIKLEKILEQIETKRPNVTDEQKKKLANRIIYLYENETKEQFKKRVENSPNSDILKEIFLDQ